MARTARVSPERILDAAAEEFAARGFGGARVDRIAARARVNKAMLYYHFQSKRGLYRALLRGVFTEAAGRLRRIAEQPGNATDKLDRTIEAFASFIRERRVFPAIMLREIAEGGAHLDTQTLQALAAIPQAFFGLLHEGIASGRLQRVDPAVAYFSITAPIVFYLAAGPIRRRLTAGHVVNLTALSHDDFVRQFQQCVRRSLSRSDDGPKRR